MRTSPHAAPRMIACCLTGGFIVFLGGAATTREPLAAAPAAPRAGLVAPTRGTWPDAHTARIAHTARVAAVPAHFALLDAWSGAYTAVVADGPRFYASRGQHLEVWDAIDPDRPTRLGTTERLGGLASVRAAGGGWAVVEVADDAGWTATPMSAHRLRLVDVRDGAQPAVGADLPVPLALRGEYGAAGANAFEVALADGEAYVTSSDDRPMLYVVDVAGPGGPRIRATVALPAIPVSLAADSGWLAVADKYNVDVYRLWSPSEPVFRGRYVFDVADPSMGRLTAIAADGGRLVVATGGTLRTFSPLGPVPFEEIGRVDACGQAVWIMALAAGAGHAAAACSRMWEPGYNVGAFATTATAAPVNVPLEGGWAWDMGHHGLAIGGDVLAAADQEGGLTFYHAVDGAWAPRHHERTLGNPSALSFDGSRLWATDFDDELWAIDLADPAQPRLESVTDDVLYGVPSGDPWDDRSGSSMSSFTNALLVDRGMAYVGHRGSRFAGGSWMLVDVRNPLRPVAAGEWDPIRADGLEVYHPTSDYTPVRAGDRILMSGRYLGLASLDATDPAHPRQAAVVRSEADVAGGIAVQADGRTAWVALGADGLGVFDVAGDALREIGRVTGIAESVDVALGGGHAFVGSMGRLGDVAGHTAVVEPGGLSVIDAVGRQVIARLPGPDVLRVALAGPTTLITLERVADGYTDPAMRLRAYDIADPLAPAARGEIALPAGWEDPLTPLAVAGDVVIAGAGPAGLLVYRLADGADGAADRASGRAYLPLSIVRR